MGINTDFFLSQHSHWAVVSNNLEFAMFTVFVRIPCHEKVFLADH